ncbi:MAG TPA: hypothetical protein P5121_18110 [Caldilineaceae bacterium]|nr:hypothetical protein [Caldilineaceae bacterium]
MAQKKPLTSVERGRRLAYDYRVVMAMAAQTKIFALTAFRTVDDMEANRRPITTEADAHEAAVYRVDYYLRTLIGRGTYTDRVQVYINLLAGNNYPYTPPVSYQLSKPTLWNPHFHATFPYCDGNIWEPGDGQVLLAHYVIHQIKAINFADLQYQPDNYVGWNESAVKYWKRDMKRQPITPGLAYPTIPVELTHSLSTQESIQSAFQIVEEVGIAPVPVGGVTIIDQPTAAPTGAVQIIATGGAG